MSFTFSFSSSGPVQLDSNFLSALLGSAGASHGFSSLCTCGKCNLPSAATPSSTNTAAATATTNTPATTATAGTEPAKPKKALVSTRLPQCYMPFLTYEENLRVSMVDIRLNRLIIGHEMFRRAPKSERDAVEKELKSLGSTKEVEALAKKDLIQSFALQQTNVARKLQALSTALQTSHWNFSDPVYNDPQLLLYAWKLFIEKPEKGSQLTQLTRSQLSTMCIFKAAIDNDKIDRAAFKPCDCSDTSCPNKGSDMEFRDPMVMSLVNPVTGINEEAALILKDTFKFNDETGSFISDEQLRLLMKKVKKLPLSEQQFLMIPVRENGYEGTILARIHEIGVKVLMLTGKYRKKFQVIPSFGMMQTSIDTMFSGKGVRLNPVFGMAGSKDLETNPFHRMQDIALPFNGIKPIKMADGYPSPGHQYPLHDFYHALLHSGMPQKYAIFSIQMAMYVYVTPKDGVIDKDSALFKLKERFFDLEGHSYRFDEKYDLSERAQFWLYVGRQIAIIQTHKSQEDAVEAADKVLSFVSKYGKKIGIRSSDIVMAIEEANKISKKINKPYMTGSIQGLTLLQKVAVQ